MKTSEFKEKVESIGYELARGKDDCVITISGDAIGTATVSTKEILHIVSVACRLELQPSLLSLPIHRLRIGKMKSVGTW